MLKLRNFAAFAAVLMATALASVVPAAATPSDPDPSYGLGGTALGPAEISSSSTVALAAYPDGRAVILGNLYHDSPTPDEWVLVRYSTDGLPDSSFSGDGVRSGTFATSGDAKALALYANGDIAIAGGGGGAFAGALVDAGGVSSVGGTNSSPGSSCHIEGLALLGNEVTGAGSCSSGTVPMAERYVQQPSNPTSFGSGGFATAGSGSSAFNAVTLLPDGKPLAAGYRISSGTEDFFIVNYTNTGGYYTPFTDGVFLSGGRVTVPVGDSNDEANAIALAPDGKIVVAGYAQFSSTGSTTNAAVVRLNPDGSLDTTFGSGGKVILKFGDADAMFNGVTVQPNGKVVAVGSLNSGTVQPLIARFSSSGALDASFAPSGMRVGIPGVSSGKAYGVAVAADGKILVGESLVLGAQRFPAVTRLLGGEVPGDNPSQPVSKPTAKIKSPSKSKLKAKKFTSVAGSATDATSAQVAILKTDTKLLKKKKRCLQMKSSKAALKKVKSVKGKCQPAVWLTASGAASWSYKLKKPLKPGKYTLFVRATGPGGTSESVKKSLTLTK